MTSRIAHGSSALKGWVIPALLILVWWASYGFGWTHSALFVPIDAVFAAGRRLAASGELWRALAASLLRMLAGFALGTFVGIVVGLSLGLSRLLERAVGPTFHTVKQVSLFAWLPLISLWCGLGEFAKVVFIALAAFFPVVVNVFDGVRGVPREWIEVARVFEFSRAQTLLRVVLPAAVASIFTGISLALIFAWLATLGAEYLMTAGSGIGNLLTDGREHFWIDVEIVGIVIVGLVGFGLTALSAALQARALRSRAQIRPNG